MADVKLASAIDLPEVVATLAEAFHAVPIFRWFIPDETRRAAILPAFFAAMCEAYLPWGEIHRSADGLAAAVWAPPGEHMPEAQAAVLGPKLAAALGEYGATSAEIRPLLAQWHPRYPHYFLHFLAVRPAAQGRGYGSALLRTVLDRCDAEGIPAHLDATSEENKRLYERHKFVVTARVTLRDSPPLWCMLRDVTPQNG
ncbi:N-acetyltransferase [Sporichthya sp.]|uniref:GNAT family N-acetyltransferase n=1 Tax=Sporichthya sp. TaxID=65475 RepID=UPI0017E7F201|nr:GNAT family N-acetyltransferase [Sporichthya sp.]MBA3742721.1 GNAT family N-acetyltransferase [Sporichthya sp.]